MTRALPIAVGLILASAAWAGERWLCTIASTSTVSRTHWDAGCALGQKLNTGGYYAVQCDATSYVVSGKGSGLIEDGGNGVKLTADQLYDIPMKVGDDTIATRGSAGNSNCRLFSVSP